MKRYTFEVVITEQSDEWWEEITEGGKSGCDEVLSFVEHELVSAHLDVSVKLKSFEDK